MTPTEFLPAPPSRLLPSTSWVQQVSALKLFTHFPTFALYWQYPYSPLVVQQSFGCFSRFEVIFVTFCNVMADNSEQCNALLDPPTIFLLRRLSFLFLVIIIHLTHFA